MDYIRLQRIGIVRSSARLFGVLKAILPLNLTRTVIHSHLFENLKSMFEDSSSDRFMLFIPCYFGYRTEIFSVLTDDQKLMVMPLKN